MESWSLLAPSRVDFPVVDRDRRRSSKPSDATQEFLFLAITPQLHAEHTAENEASPSTLWSARTGNRRAIDGEELGGVLCGSALLGLLFQVVNVCTKDETIFL